MPDNDYTLAELMYHGECMVAHGWHVIHNPGAPRAAEGLVYEWSHSLRAGTFVSGQYNVPPLPAVRDAMRHKDYPAPAPPQYMPPLFASCIMRRAFAIRGTTHNPQQGDPMRNLLLFCAILATITATTHAADVLVIADDGYYLMRQDAAGVPVMHKFTQVITLTTGTTPNDPGDITPEDPPPITPGGFAKTLATKARDAAIEVNDPAAAQELAVAYTTIADSLADGELTTVQAYAAISTATDMVLARSDQAAPARWAAWRADMGNCVAELTQRGDIGNVATTAEALRAIANGLEASTNGGNAISLNDLLELVKLIIAIITAIQSGVPSAI